MYRGTKTRVKTICGRTEYFEVKLGLHQGSALNPLLFIIIMDVLAEEARTIPPWAMLFADDLVLVSETAEEVEEELERWRSIIENKGLRISRPRIPCTISSTGCSEVIRITPAIGKQFQVPWFSNIWEWRVWKGCRWTNKSRLVTMEGSIWSYI